MSFFLGLHLYASQVYRSNLMLGRYVATAFDMAGASSVNNPHFTYSIRVASRYGANPVPPTREVNQKTTLLLV